jgi:hypothetical protein
LGGQRPEDCPVAVLVKTKLSSNKQIIWLYPLVNISGKWGKKVDYKNI